MSYADGMWVCMWECVGLSLSVWMCVCVSLCECVWEREIEIRICPELCVIVSPLVLQANVAVVGDNANTVCELSRGSRCMCVTLQVCGCVCVQVCADVGSFHRGNMDDVTKKGELLLMQMMPLILLDTHTDTQTHTQTHTHTYKPISRLAEWPTQLVRKLTH